MKPIKTESTNGVLLPAPGTEAHVFKLPVTHTATTVCSCWALSWRERLRVLWTGGIWFSCHGHTHPPIKLWVR